MWMCSFLRYSLYISWTVMYVPAFKFILCQYDDAQLIHRVKDIMMIWWLCELFWLSINLTHPKWCVCVATKIMFNNRLVNINQVQIWHRLSEYNIKIRATWNFHCPLFLSLCMSMMPPMLPLNCKDEEENHRRKTLRFLICVLSTFVRFIFSFRVYMYLDHAGVVLVYRRV